MHPLLEPGDPRVPPREHCVVGELLAARAARRPDGVFVVFEDESRWTNRDVHDRARSTAVGLRALGVGKGDPVLSWLPNGGHALATWFGTNLLGGVHVPVNTAYRGTLLEHVIRNSGARVMVAHAGLLDRLAGLDLGSLRHIVAVPGPTTAVPAGVEVHGADVFANPPDGFVPSDDPVQPWDTMAIIYTSGTTGPSKGVLCSYVHHYSAATSEMLRVTADDRYLVNLPLFHAGGTEAVYYMLVTGGSIALTEVFDTDGFWPLVRRFGVTGCTLLGAMVSFLVGRPPSPRDRDHPLRGACVVPLTADALVFRERFGVDVYTGFNMTETSCPLISPINPDRVGSCGRPRPGVQVRIVDEHDREVPVGTVGELVVRTDRPWAMSHGYHAMPEATARAWRNGWFHTGDALYRDEHGDFFFVDRLKDAIRRRGENISSFEVENEVLRHPDVQEAAVVGVPSEHSEDEVLAVVVPVPGRSVDPADLLEHLRPLLPHFMLPRYVRVVDALPRTPTEKVRKVELREQGLAPGTWDREAAGVRVRRERIATVKGGA